MSRQELRLALAGMSIIAVAFGFARYGYGLFVPVFRDEFGLSTEAIGLISGAAYGTYVAALLLAGFLAVRLNPRVPVLVGGACAAAGMTLIAVASNGAVMAAGALLASTSPGWAWAPFSDAAAQLISEDARSRALSIISTGTTFGLAMAGPIALLAGSTWRASWLAFAVLAFASTVWNARLLPKGPPRSAGQGPDHGGLAGSPDGNPAPAHPGWRWFVTADAHPLYFVAFIFGIAGAFYWTYAADLAQDSGLPSATGPVLWSIVGLAGIVGVATGDFVERFAFGRVLAVALCLLATAIAVLGAVPGSWLSVIASAALYGPSFMMMSALLVLWSSRVFSDRPSTGFSAALVLLAAGSMAGPAALGLLAGAVGLQPAFLVAASLTLLGLLGARPQRTGDHELVTTATPTER